MSSYRGRFAPSPTGPLHFGSLFAALISYLDAKKNKGSWLLRIEDIDPLREYPQASDLIIDSLESHHLFWDEEITYQSRRSVQYEAFLSQLDERQAIFRCPCSRKQLSSNQSQHSEECLKQSVSMTEYALKFRKTQAQYKWEDRFQGNLSFALRDDFVLKRKEGFYAYQLAVVNDDYQQGITHVVRGFDLLDSTPMQLALYRTLDIRPPSFAHFPILSSNGQKLSKQNHAKAVENSEALDNMRAALNLLNLKVASKEKSIPSMLSVAIELWNPEAIYGLESIPSPL